MRLISICTYIFIITSHYKSKLLFVFIIIYTLSIITKYFRIHINKPFSDLFNGFIQ